MRRTRFVVIACCLLALAGCARDESQPSGSGEQSEAAGSEPIEAQPPPAVPPEPVAASGPDCAAAMESLRALIIAVPTGSMLDDAQNAQLTTGLDGLDAVCAESEADAFREQELVPWLTYTPPA